MLSKIEREAPKKCNVENYLSEGGGVRNTIVTKRGGTIKKGREILI